MVGNLPAIHTAGKRHYCFLDIFFNLYWIFPCTMSFKTIRQAIQQRQAGAIPFLQWSYSGFTVWKARLESGQLIVSVNPFLTFFPLPKKDNEGNKMKLDQK